jgi:hypothetical protein
MYEMPLDQAMQQYAPQVQQPMAGTLTPQQMQQQNQQKAIVDALRGMGQTQQAAPAQAGRVTSTGALGDGMDTKGIGGALGSMFSGGYSAPADLAGTSFI